MEHRLVDVVGAPLLIGIAGSLIVLIFQRKLEAISRRGGGAAVILCVAAFLLLIAALLVVGQIVDFIIPVPVPTFHVSSPPSGFAGLAGAIVVGSQVVLVPLIGGFYRDPAPAVNKAEPHNPFDQPFTYILIGCLMVSMMSRQPPFWPRPEGSSENDWLGFVASLIALGGAFVIHSCNLPAQQEQPPRRSLFLKSGMAQQEQPPRRRSRFLKFGTFVGLSLAWAGAVGQVLI